MSEVPEETALHNALRDGLRALPFPETSPNFDDRVLIALRAPQPWWQRVCQPAKPLLLSASCSLAVMLLALHWTLSAPVSLAPPERGDGRQAAAPVHLPSLDALLDQPHLSAGSLTLWDGLLAPHASGAGQPSSPDSRPEPHRRAQVLRRSVLVV